MADAAATASTKALQRKLDQARTAASFLRDRGEHFYAEQILVLCRTAQSLHQTAVQLSADLRMARGEQ